MSNCLECNKELEQTPGKRAKQYCGNTCRVKYYLKKKNKDKPPGKRGRPAGSLNKSNQTIPPPQDASGINEDEGKNKGKKKKEEKTESEPTSLADMFKGRNINERTYVNPKIAKGGDK